ncbi:BnaCnng21580D [Brassica napus]|uniref:BnaCnng21580D protein n=2 Tax=Brassica napus TaxID=3708 RepID=A0A078ISD7_BRANA|nr:BnaCnng21580D [Brassica napus]
MAPLVAGPDSLPRPPSDPPDSNLKFALPSNPPDPPVPPDPPPDTLVTGFLWLYDFWATITFPHKFSDPKLVCSCSFTAVCRCCPFTAVCRLPSTFALMAFAMIRHSLLLWQLGVKVLKLCILPANLVCLGSNCPLFSFKECFVLPHLSLVISETVIGSIVLKMVLFKTEVKMFIVSRLDGVNYLTSLTMEVFIPPLYCFKQECQFEEVFLIDCPLSGTPVVELVISPLSLSFYLSTCCLSFLICLSSVLVYALVCLAPCSHIVFSIDGVELF